MLSNSTIAISCTVANEVGTLRRFIEEVLDECKLFKKAVFVAVFDKASIDGSYQLALDLAEENDCLIVTFVEGATGPTDSYLHGFQVCIDLNFDFILDMNAGFRHLPSEMHKFFVNLDGYDCVFGSRFMPGGSLKTTTWLRRFYSEGGTTLANAVFGTNLTDMTSGFQLFSKDALVRVLECRPKSKFHFLQTEVKVLCKNLKIKEVPINYETSSPNLKLVVLVDAALNFLRMLLTHNRFASKT